MLFCHGDLWFKLKQNLACVCFCLNEGLVVYMAKKMFLFSGTNIHQFFWSVLPIESIVKIILRLAFIERWWCSRVLFLSQKMGEKEFQNFYKMVVTLLWGWLFVVVILSKYHFLPGIYSTEEVNLLYCRISIWVIKNFKCAVTWVGSKENDSSNGQLCEESIKMFTWTDWLIR